MTNIKLTDKEYFADTTAISNSQLRDFVSYSKYEQRLLTPDKYVARHIEKSIEFKMNEAVIKGKIVDLYFDGSGEKCWEKYIPMKRRTNKEVDKLINLEIEDQIGKMKLPLDEALLSEDQKEEVELLKKEAAEKFEDYMEITMGMKESAEEMIEWGNAFRQFREFLMLEGTEAQLCLREKLKLTDKEGTIFEVEVKGKPDYVNEDIKLIVDLKTTGSTDMIIEGLQFKGKPKLTAAYIRQLSIYNKLQGGGYDGALALVTDTGVKWIAIPNEILEEAWLIIEQDMIDLYKYLEDPKTLNESIFIECELTLD